MLNKKGKKFESPFKVSFKSQNPCFVVMIKKLVIASIFNSTFFWLHTGHCEQLSKSINLTFACPGFSLVKFKVSRLRCYLLFGRQGVSQSVLIVYSTAPRRLVSDLRFESRQKCKCVLTLHCEEKAVPKVAFFLITYRY